MSPASTFGTHKLGASSFPRMESTQNFYISLSRNRYSPNELLFYGLWTRVYISQFLKAVSKKNDRDVFACSVKDFEIS